MGIEIRKVYNSSSSEEQAGFGSLPAKDREDILASLCWHLQTRASYTHLQSWQNECFLTLPYFPGRQMGFYNDQLSAALMRYQAVEDTRAKVSNILYTEGRLNGWRSRLGGWITWLQRRTPCRAPRCFQAPTRSPHGSQPCPPKHIQGSLGATTASTITSLFSVRLYKACQAAKGTEGPLLWDSALGLALSLVDPRDGRMLGRSRVFSFSTLVSPLWFLS